MKLVRVHASNAIKWINGELSFDDEPTDQVFRKEERWYNVEIDYTPCNFEGETLIVNIGKGEPVDQLF